MSKRKFTHVWTWLLAGFLVLACLSLNPPTAAPLPSLLPTLTPPAVSFQPSLTPFSPSTMEPSLTPPPTLTFTPTPTFTFTPTPTLTFTPTPTLTFTPTPTLTFTPTPTLTFTPTSTPSPTNTALPNVTDFDQVLTFGGGGGGGGSCQHSMYPPPTVYALQDEDYLHLIAFCSYEYPIPIGQPIHLAISSSDSNYNLQDDFQINRDNDGCTEKHCSYWGREYWWPVGLPAGLWQWRMSWDGGEVSGTLETRVSSPEISVLDNLAYGKLRTTEYLRQCHSAAGSTGLVVIGRGFPANSNIYIPIYEQLDSTEYQPFHVQTTTTDGMGAFRADLSASFLSGKSYLVIGLSDPNTQYTDDGNNYIKKDIASTIVDCFIVP